MIGDTEASRQTPARLEAPDLDAVAVLTRPEITP
jgi:hypothetical protein